MVSLTCADWTKSDIMIKKLAPLHYHESQIFVFKNIAGDSQSLTYGPCWSQGISRDTCTFGRTHTYDIFYNERKNRSANIYYVSIKVQAKPIVISCIALI